MIDFTGLKNLYNNQMDMLLANDGLTTEVTFTFGVSKKQLCPNCIFDPNLKKSANKYKSGGPTPFELGKLCPYCNGIGYYGETNTETGYLAIIWDYKKWINPPANISISDGMIQTICDKTYLSSIRQCKDITVLYPGSNNKKHKFQLFAEPNPGGLGDNNYLITLWKKVN
jgi:hypothetical protein